MHLTAPRHRSARRRPFSFRTFTTHRERDPESALMHYRARSYDPRTGRFMQAEPLTLLRVDDPYVYARNRPTSATDPRGLFAVDVHENLTDRLGEGTRGANQYSPGVRALIAAYNVLTDFKSLLSGRAAMQFHGSAPDLIPDKPLRSWELLHFDNLPTEQDIKNEWDALEAATRAAINDVMNSSANRAQKAERLAIALGQSLHAVQDFYSHSNWVDLGVKAGKKESDIPTWFAGNAQAYRAEIGRLGPLLTGSFKKDPAKGQPSHDELNKDTKDRPLFPEARAVALRATFEWDEKFRGMITDPALRAFFITLDETTNAIFAENAASLRGAMTPYARLVGGRGDQE